MPRYRRWRTEGGVLFFTLVTHRRMRIFHLPWARRLLRESIARMREKHPVKVDAIVLLPDHLHTLWRLPKGETDYSTRIAVMKKRFTDSYLAHGGREGPTTPSRRRHRVRGVWEKRFYEHTIRDSADYARHFDYVHWNPVKHGYVDRAADWPWSTFHRYVRSGEYQSDWAGDPVVPGGVNVEPDDW